jgi:steroid delta-isomerase-like uncharacterized protein
MSAEENVRLMRRWFKEVWNEGRIQTIYELLDPETVAIGELEDGKALRGPADFVSFAENLRGAFPDMDIVVEDVFGADDKVALRWSATMTHSGNHLGIPATGNVVRLTRITIARICGGKIVQGWDNWDQLEMQKQIGVHDNPQTTLLKSA